MNKPNYRTAESGWGLRNDWKCLGWERFAVALEVIDMFEVEKNCLVCCLNAPAPVSCDIVQPKMCGCQWVSSGKNVSEKGRMCVPAGDLIRKRGPPLCLWGSYNRSTFPARVGQAGGVIN